LTCSDKRLADRDRLSGVEHLPDVCVLRTSSGISQGISGWCRALIGTQFDWTRECAGALFSGFEAIEPQCDFAGGLEAAKEEEQAKSSVHDKDARSPGINRVHELILLVAMGQTS
jgi:hypothetical protein